MTNYMTKKTFERLQERFASLLKVEKPAIIKEVKTAKEHGDLRENAEYHAARDKQKVILAEIDLLFERLDAVEFIDDLPIPGDRVSVGTVVLLKDEDGTELKYTILGPEDSDSDQNIISILAPLAKGLMGKEKGDKVELQLPGKKKIVEIISVAPYFN